jgi:pimeloyl-ACP methyl ester carboxylesterase
MADDPRFAFLETNGIRLHAACAGPEDGPLVILLHGFPEFWYGWRHQIGPLAEAGYRVLAPDQRGYNKSDKPAGVASYALDRLVADVVGLIDATGRRTATVVGHDWGGVVAWWLALRHADRLERIVVLNAPHPEAYRRSLLRHPLQMLRSWYILAFQIPGLPEIGLRRRNWRALERALRRTSRPGTFGAADFEHYRRAWSEPGAITAMIHWYRAGLRAHPRLPEDVRIRVPTLLIWGAQDGFLDRRLARPSVDLCDDGRLGLIEEATHWVQHEEPGRVNRLLLDALAAAVPRPGPA